MGRLLNGPLGSFPGTRAHQPVLSWDTGTKETLEGQSRVLEKQLYKVRSASNLLRNLVGVGYVIDLQ